MQDPTQTRHRIPWYQPLLIALGWFLGAVVAAILDSALPLPLFGTSLGSMLGSAIGAGITGLLLRRFVGHLSSLQVFLISVGWAVGEAVRGLLAPTIQVDDYGRPVHSYSPGGTGYTLDDIASEVLFGGSVASLIGGAFLCVVLSRAGARLAIRHGVIISLAWAVFGGIVPSLIHAFLAELAPYAQHADDPEIRMRSQWITTIFLAVSYLCPGIAGLSTLWVLKRRIHAHEENNA